jgi:anaerobic magnesium-protoporphyrin IX monomethyl ester cyclase
MAKIVFAQKIAEEWLGVMYISSMLKHHGHQCDVYVDSLEKGNIVEKILSESADVIAFSCLTSDYYWALDTAKKIKERSDALIVFGGTHITINPDDAIMNPYIDVICLGEGEYPVLELANTIDKGGNISHIKNLWIKDKGRIIKNDLRNLIEDLDSLPHPDRKLYAKYPYFRKRGKRPLHVSRGCPYKCSYCHNARKQIIFKNKGKYIRWRSIDSVLEEIDDIQKKSFVTTLHFIDDSFGIDYSYLTNLMERLSKGTGKRLNIHANMRADKLTEKLCKAFQCYGVDFLRIRIAVECGDENYRNKVLKKGISNRELIQAAELFHRYKIDFIVYNMIGLPGETFEQALKTLRLNIKLKPILALCFIYQPYPGTGLSQYALENGYLNLQMLDKMGKHGYEGFFHSQSVLIQTDIKKAENIQKVFSATVKFPFLFPIVKYAVNYPSLSLFFRLFYKVYIRYILLIRHLKDKY